MDNLLSFSTPQQLRAPSIIIMTRARYRTPANASTHAKYRQLALTAYLSPTDATQNFPAFNLLLPELQLLIWQYSIDDIGPRIVELRREKFKVRRGVSQYWFTSCPIPPVLHACSTSRHIKLDRWHLCFDDIDNTRIFFDLKEDILYFSHESKNMQKFMRSWAAKGTEKNHCRMEYTLTC